MPQGPTQYRNAKGPLNLATDNQRRYEPNFAWVNAIAALTMIPACRGVWPMSTGGFVAGVPVIGEASGQYKYLNRRSVPTYSRDGLIPYVNFDGANDQLYAATATHYNILGNDTTTRSTIRGLSLGGWFYFDDAPPLADKEHLIGMWSTLLADRAYRLVRLTDGTLRFQIGDGAATPGIATTTILTSGKWYFCAGSWDPNVLQYVYVNTTPGELEEASGATIAVPLVTSAQDFSIGSFMAGTDDRLDGGASLCWLAASYLEPYQIESIFHAQRALFGK